MLETAFNHVLVTGAAGFIGYHVTHRLLQDQIQVTGLDNLNPYYDVSLKEARLAQLTGWPGFDFVRADLADAGALKALFESRSFDGVINLAAQAGVRYSLTHPETYAEANLSGFVNLLECCRHYPVKHLVFASSSSVYGANTRMPFAVHHNVDHPVSLYAATKKANELLAHTYSHLYGLPATGLRFFTVYGPWGRPDMALFLFTRAILADQPIQVFNHGQMQRDFTYIDDITEGVVRVLARPAQPDPDWRGEAPNPATSNAPYRIYNIGNNQPVRLNDFIAILEKILGKEARKEYLPLQPGDVVATYADIDALQRDTGFAPATPLETGMRHFVNWYQSYYNT